MICLVELAFLESSIGGYLIFKTDLLVSEIFKSSTSKIVLFNLFFKEFNSLFNSVSLDSYSSFKDFISDAFSSSIIFNSSSFCLILALRVATVDSKVFLSMPAF